MIEQETTLFTDLPKPEIKLNRFIKLKLGLIIGFRILLCPGDDIALALMQTVNSTNPDTPSAAMLYESPDVITVFEIKTPRGKEKV